MSYKNIECDKILLISDTHGDNETYKKIIKKNKPDVVLHAGDFYDSKSRDSFDLDSFKKVVNFYIEGNHGIKEKNIEYIKKVTDKKEGKTRRLFMYKKLIKDYEIVKLNGENFLLIHVFDDEKYNFFCDDE
jgi:predicted phosphodiesterase